MSPLSALIDDTYLMFRGFLENERLIEFEFDFLIANDQKSMLPRFEKFNPFGEEVYMICKTGGCRDQSK